MRPALALLGFMGVFFGPWWVAVICMVLLSLRFRAWEVLVMGLTMDFLWLPAGLHVPIFTLTALFVVWVAEPLRMQLLLQ